MDRVFAAVLVILSVALVLSLTSFCEIRLEISGVNQEEVSR